MGNRLYNAGDWKKNFKGKVRIISVKGDKVLIFSLKEMGLIWVKISNIYYS